MFNTYFLYCMKNEEMGILHGRNMVNCTGDLTRRLGNEENSGGFVYVDSCIISNSEISLWTQTCVLAVSKYIDRKINYLQMNPISPYHASASVDCGIAFARSYFLWILTWILYGSECIQGIICISSEVYVVHIKVN